MALQFPYCEGCQYARDVKMHVADYSYEVKTFCRISNRLAEVTAMMDCVRVIEVEKVKA